MPFDLSRRQALIGGGFLLAGDCLAQPALSVFDAVVAELMRRASIPGLALGVTQDGEVIATRAYGWADVAARRPVTNESMFHIASVTKTVTALAIMQLVDEGRIALKVPGQLTAVEQLTTPIATLRREARDGTGTTAG